MRKTTKTTKNNSSNRQVCPSCGKRQTPTLLHTRKVDCGCMYGLMKWETFKCSKCGNVYVNRSKVKTEEEK